MNDTGNIIKTIAGALGEAIARHERELTKEYQNISHYMRSDIEVQNPSDNEMYIFFKNGWDIVDGADIITITKKKNMETKNNELKRI